MGSGSARAQIGEGGEEPGLPGDLMQELCDADARHHRVKALCEVLRFRDWRCPDRRDRQAPVNQRDAIELPSCKTPREALQPIVEFLATLSQPVLRSARQAEASGDGCRRRRGGQIGVKASV